MLGAALATTANAADVTVSIDNFTFTPTQITVPSGSKIIWTNGDDIPHTITHATEPRLFKSAVMDTGETFSFVFTTHGTYAYFCSLHPHMQATVVVT